MIDVLLEVLDEIGADYRLMEYDEPEKISREMKNFDAVIASTLKSLSHTESRKESNRFCARIDSIPGIYMKVWNEI